MHLIEKLKRKSEPEKTRYAFLLALGATLLMGAVWTTSLPARFAKIGETEDGVHASDTSEGVGFAELLETSKAQMGSVIEGIQESDTLPESSEGDAYPPSTDAFDSLTPSGYEPEDVPLPVTGVFENSIEQREGDLAATSSTVTILAKPAPQIIMIATTTSQKSE